MKWQPTNWRDILSILVIVGLPCFWGWLLSQQWSGSDIVIGTTLSGWTLAIQFYYRKAQNEAEPPTVPHG